MLTCLRSLLVSLKRLFVRVFTFGMSVMGAMLRSLYVVAILVVLFAQCSYRFLWATLMSIRLKWLLSVPTMPLVDP